MTTPGQSTTTNSPKIRPMRWWDIDDVHRIETECFPDDCWSIDQFWRELAGETRDYFVAVAEAPVGYVGISTLSPDSDLQTLATDPGCRGTGVGRALLSRAINVAVERGATSMILEVRADNHSATGLYESCEFEPIAKRSRYYPDGGDAVIMRKRPLKAGVV